MVFGVAQAVPDVALQVAAAVVGVEGEGPPAKPACLGVVSQERVVPAGRVEQFGLACPLSPMPRNRLADCSAWLSA
jgi:hypothetical protein